MFPALPQAMTIPAWLPVVLAIPVLLLGEWLVKRIAILGRFNIPAPVVGGLLVSLGVLAFNLTGNDTIEFITNVSGFHVFCGNRISPTDETAMENLARYIIRASFSQERMQYLDQEGTVVYRSKRGEPTKSFPAMEWLAAMSSHIQNRGEQMVRYYGWYSNASRGRSRHHQIAGG